MRDYNRYAVSSGDDKNIPEVTVVMIVVQLHEYIGTQRTVHFKWVNYLICELCHNKAAIITFF